MKPRLMSFVLLEDDVEQQTKKLKPGKERSF